MIKGVGVKPSDHGRAVQVAVDEIVTDGKVIQYPLYKPAYGAEGSVTQVDATNPIPAGAYTTRSDTLTPLVADGGQANLQTDEDGALWVHEKHNEVNSGNSTTDVLAGDAVFTGTGVDLLSFASVSIIIDSSHDSATDGMQFQFSSDNTNWDKSFNFTYTAADGSRVFQLPIHAKYFRLVYTNGNTLQDHFRLQCLLLHFAPVQTTHRLVDDVSPDRSGALVKAALIAQKAGTGDLALVQSTAGGNLKFSLEEFDETFNANPLPVIDKVLSEAFDEVQYLSTYLLDTATVDMAVDGTTPVTYKYTVPADTIFYIKRGFLVIEDGAVAFVPGNFAALGSAITNGVSIGITPSGGSRVEIENWKTNRQIRDTMFDFNTEFRVDGAYVGRWSFTRDMNLAGIVLGAGDIFDFIIQDDLTGLDYLSFKLKGVLKAV